MAEKHRFVNRLIVRLLGKPGRFSKGIALIASLLVMIVLVLLVLALLLQSDTEYETAKNEQETIITLHYTEAGLEWARRKILNASGAANFSDLLNGPNNGATTDDNLIGLKTLALSDTGVFDSTNEMTDSAIVTRNFGDGNKTYEAFRIGVDEDGVTTTWEGPRALVYVRIDDNFDEYPNANAPLLDVDRNISATAVSEYPVYVNSTGVQTNALRNTSRRMLRIRVGPQNLQAAIVTEHSLTVNGNPKTCGDCGSIHANDHLRSPGDAYVCQNFTAHLTYGQSGNPTVIGSKGGGFPEIDVPIINPYDDVLVPRPSNFNGIQFGCDSTTPKYFAFIPKLDGSGKGLIYKAYWDNAARPSNSAGGWKWRLIDDLNEGGNTILDNCGRVVSGSVGGTALTPDAGAGTGINDTKDDEFYGIKLGGTFSAMESCSGDESLCSGCTLGDNDYNSVDYYRFSDNTLVNDANLPVFPGSFDPDGVRDFPNNRIKEGNPKWEMSANLVYSPLYNAVLWFFGEFHISGNPGTDGKICTAGQDCGNTGSLSGLPDGVWRVSLISVGSLHMSGNVGYSPANTSGGFAFLLISGRDIDLNGNSVGGQAKCQSSGCGVITGNSASLAGIIAAHEQIKSSGNYTFDGFMFIEDAVNCATAHVRSGDPPAPDFSGNPQIHYDCNNPPNPWQNAIRVTSWQEIQ